MLKFYSNILEKYSNKLGGSFIMLHFDKEATLRLIRKIEERMRSERPFLNELDRAVGDGDHGDNMEAALLETRHSLAKNRITDVGMIVNIMGDSFLNAGGGAGTFLYGTGIKKSSAVFKGKDNVGFDEFKMFLEELSQEIKTLGHVEVNQKTMYDVLEPVTKMISQHDEFSMEVLENMLIAAEEGMVSTRDMLALKGRASYLGEKTIGHLDPGAYSMYLIFQVFYDFYKDLVFTEFIKKHSEI